jgi:ribonuclease R
MTQTTPDQMKKLILQFLAKYPSEEFKPRVLAHRLAIKKQDEFRIFSQALNELAQSKEVNRVKHKRYSHGTPPPSSRLTGVYSGYRMGAAIVTLSPPASGQVTVQARFIGTALEGDTVSVVLFAQNAPEGGRSETLPEAEIVEVIERSGRPVVGVFEKGKSFFFVVPDSRKVGRDVYIPQGKTHGAKPGEKVVAVIDSWESPNLSPEGHIIEVLGRSGEVRAEMTSVAREFQLPLKFPRSVIDEAESISSTIPHDEIGRRLDLRKLDCVTIDPEDAKDFDDAVSLETLADGNLRLGVHIADVSHYVTEGTALDVEALQRGTSVYLADSVIPMLPEKLSNDLCSLRPKEDRLAYTAFIILSPKGVIQEHTISKSIIHSKRRFSYEEVQRVIETGRGDFSEMIAAMHALSTTLLKKRLKEGSIDFDSDEAKFRFDKEGKPIEIVKKPRLAAHRLVEDFMLLANQVVAKHIALARKEEQIKPFIYRIHDSPPPDRLKDLAAFVEHLGYSLPIAGGVRSHALQKLLDDVRGKEEENVINEVAIRSMAKAVYAVENIGHFGLGFKHYTHFTSPIRRYPDLIVHRLLHEYEKKLTAKRLEEIRGLLPDICKQSSDRERVAMEAERASSKVMKVEYMKRHIGEEFDAIISGVTNYGLFVEITDLLVEGLIRVRDMEDDYYVFDEKKFQMVGKRTKKRYRLGDKVKIRVVRVNPEERQIDFSLVR